MKIIKKILIAFLVATLSLSLGIAAFASEAESPLNTTETATEEKTTETTADEGIKAEENPFEAIFNTISAYSSEIFSALAFIGTLIVAYFYKKGILPTLKKALCGVSTALDSVGEKTSGVLTPILTRTEEVAETTAFLKNGIDSALSSLESLEEKLESLEEQKSERTSYRTVMLSQVDMLYDIFMSSSLPQYKKDEIGEKIGTMREELKLCGEKTE